MRRSYRRPISRRVAVVPRRSTVKRQAFGNFASAMQQRDSTNVVISTQEQVDLYIPPNCNEATLVRNVNAILTSTEYFANYMGMYDQYKINAVRASMEMVSIGNQILSTGNFPSICTSWDRNGVKIDNVEVSGVRYYMLPTYSVVASYSSANEKTLYYGSRWGVVRQLDAASMMEKSMYIPTTGTKDVLTVGNMYSAWNPQLLIGVRSPQSLATEQSCAITIHWQFDVTLRGLRKVPVSNLTKFVPIDGFIGYAKNNKGLVVNNNANGKAVVGTADGVKKPTINPNSTGTAGENTGIVVPNDGYPGATQNVNP